jgi:hypothetical protein
MRRPLVVVGLAAAVALAFAVARLVETDEEAIESLLSGTAESAKRGDWAAVRRALADDFEGHEPDAVVAWARGLVGSAAYPGWSFTVDAIEVDGDRAVARASVRLGPYGSHSGEVGLAREDAGWRVRSIAPDDARLLRRGGPR